MVTWSTDGMAKWYGYRFSNTIKQKQSSGKSVCELVFQLLYVWECSFLSYITLYVCFPVSLGLCFSVSEFVFLCDGFCVCLCVHVSCVCFWFFYFHVWIYISARVCVSLCVLCWSVRVCESLCFSVLVCLWKCFSFCRSLGYCLLFVSFCVYISVQVHAFVSVYFVFLSLRLCVFLTEQLLELYTSSKHPSHYWMKSFIGIHTK